MQFFTMVSRWKRAEVRKQTMSRTSFVYNRLFLVTSLPKKASPLSI
jgi:hypothetical protein